MNILKDFFVYIFIVIFIFGCSNNNNALYASIETNVTLIQDDIATIPFTIYDKDNDIVIVTIIQNTMHGNTVLNSNNFIYTPNKNYFGSDQLILKFDDQNGNIIFKTIDITITPILKNILGKVIIDGYVENAKVCVDFNVNYKCDEKEHYGITNAKGDFNFEGSKYASEVYPVLVELNSSVKINLNDENSTIKYIENNYLILTPPNKYSLISPFSILVLFEMTDNPYINNKNIILNRVLKKEIFIDVIEAEDNIKTNLNIESNQSIYYDYVTNKVPEMMLLENIIYKMQVELFESHEFFTKNENNNIYTIDILTTIVEGIVNNIQSNSSIIKGSVIAQDKSFNVEDKKLPLMDKNSFSNIPYIQGMSIATGIDAITREPIASSCIQNIELNEPICQNHLEFKFEYIENLSELSSLLGGSISGLVEVKTGIVKGSASLKFNYSENFFENEENIYILVSANYINCSQSLIKPKLDSAYQEKYSENYTDFRIKCGDMYMDTVTTGGRFFGVLNIHNDMHIDKQELKSSLNIKAKVDLGLTSVSSNKTFTLLDKVVREFDSHYNITVNIQSNNTQSGVFIQTVDGFLKEFEDFLIETKSDNCTGNGDYKQCGYKTGTYSSYDNIVDGYAVSDTQEKFNTIEQLKSYYNTYSDILDLIIDIENNQEKYNDFDNTYIEETNENISNIIDEIETKLISCANNFDMCENIDDLNISDISNILELPTLKISYPKDCKEAKYFYNNKNDGEYIVYFNSDKLKPYELYCINMDKEFPDNYLKFYNTSASASPKYNYVSSVNVDNYGLILEYNTQLYDAIKIEINDENLILLSTQSEFLEKIIDVKNDINNKNSNFAELNNYFSNGYASLNINLEGLPFVFSDDISYIDFFTLNDFNLVEVGENKKDLNIKLDNLNQKVIPKKLITIEYQN